MTSVALPTLAAAAISVLACTPATSHAGVIVWQSAAEIHAMRDDGTRKARLLRPASVPGATSLARPHVAADGTTLVFEGRSRLRSGASATGIYRLDRGTAVSRLSPPFADDVAPELLGTSGRVIFVHRAGATADIQTLSLGGADPQSLQLSCRAVGDLVADPAANPAAPEQVAFAGCSDSAGQDRLILSRAGRAGERVLHIDDEPIADPSFAVDGSSIVAAEGGDLPGIWTYPTAAGEPQRLLATPPGVRASSPRLIETGAGRTQRLLFAAAGDIWTAPVAACPCAFPSHATRLTHDGMRVVDTAPAWTSRTRLESRRRQG